MVSRSFGRLSNSFTTGLKRVSVSSYRLITIINDLGTEEGKIETRVSLKTTYSFNYLNPYHMDVLSRWIPDNELAGL